MPFTLQVAADLYGVRVNLQIAFWALPTLGQVLTKAQVVLAAEAVACKPFGETVQAVNIERAQVYNANYQQWVDLIDDNLIVEGAQLYVHLRGVLMLAGDIPPPAKSFNNVEAILGIPVPGPPSESPSHHERIASRSESIHLSEQRARNRSRETSPSVRSAVPSEKGSAVPQSTVHSMVQQSTRSGMGTQSQQGGASTSRSHVRRADSNGTARSTPRGSPLSSASPSRRQAEFTPISQYTPPTGSPSISQSPRNNLSPTRALASASASPPQAARGTSPLRTYNTMPAGIDVPPNIGRIPVPTVQNSRPAKVNWIFEEMDVNDNKIIEPYEWMNLMRALGIDIPDHTLKDLFIKGDADRDTVLNEVEFKRFFSQYTLMLESLFYRLRDVHHGRTLAEQLAHIQQNVREAKIAHLNSKKDLAPLAIAAQEINMKLDEAESNKQEVGYEVDNANTRLAKVQASEARANDEIAEARDASELARESEFEARSTLNECQSTAQAAESRLKAEQDNMVAAQNTVTELEAALAEAKQRLTTQIQVVSDCDMASYEARHSENTASNHLVTASETMQQCDDRIRKGEAELVRISQVSREHVVARDGLQQDLNGLASIFDRIKRDADEANERANALNSSAESALAELTAHESDLRNLDEEIRDFNSRHVEFTLKERELLEREIKLMEQRATLEERAQGLALEGVNYFNGPRCSISPSRSPRRQTIQ